MSLQLPAILSPPTPCIPLPTLTVSPWVSVTLLPFSLPGQLSVLGFAFPSQTRQCIRPYRVQHGLVYGLAVRLRLLPTPSLDDAVTFNYGQPVLCPTGTLTPLLVRTLRRTRDGLRAVRLIISGPRNGEKNGTAQRPSLPEMNEFLVERVAEAPCSALVNPL
jgi:hypothetical protein